MVEGGLGARNAWAVVKVVGEGSVCRREKHGGSLTDRGSLSTDKSVHVRGILTFKV